MRAAYAQAYANRRSAMLERKVSLFRNGRSQAVRIPKEFELPGNEAIIRKERGKLSIEPVPQEDGLIALLKRSEPIDEEWPEIDDPLPEPVDL
jgi:antitoxin VapB